MQKRKTEAKMWYAVPFSDGSKIKQSERLNLINQNVDIKWFINYNTVYKLLVIESITNGPWHLIYPLSHTVCDI